MKKTVSLILVCLLLGGALTACIPSESFSPEATAVPTDTESAGMPSTGEPETKTDTEVPMEPIETYRNPVLTASSPNAWAGYGFGDPFVMRHNGVYYLYVSTKDGYDGIKCWSSTDLIHWCYEGLCSSSKVVRGAYAPEVYYYNGYFYMYTSPAGNGHYVLRSTSPTKGFTPVTGNLGMSIDGSVFMDNDGSWYFYTANHGEMMVYPMTSPTSMSAGQAVSGISVSGAWTEGPMVVYHDGYYYMTYTGNHVLSRSYRICCGASSDSPLRFTDTAVKNPLLVNTSDKVFGIGHSSTVKGPDLDSYYIVYHSLVNMTPNRSMNVDRIIFDGGRMEIMGPTVDDQQVPSMPDVYHYFESGASLSGWQLTGGFGSLAGGLPLGKDASLVSEYRFEGDYTAEYNVASIAEGALAGAIFSYTDEKNFGICLFDPTTQTVCIRLTVDGETTERRVSMIRSFGEDVRFDCIQSLQIEHSGGTYTFYMNDRLLCRVEHTALSGGSIGYITEGGEASFGFIGGTGAVGGRGVADTYKTVSAESGLIPADSFLSGSFETAEREGLTAVLAKDGDVLNYRILAAEDGDYDLALFYATQGAHHAAAVEVLVDGTPTAILSVSSALRGATVIHRAIPLSKGAHVLSIRPIGGELALMRLQMLLSHPVRDTEIALGERDGHVYTDGPWERAGGGLCSGSSAKRLFGQENWGDYAVEVTVTPQSAPNCGLLVRATEPGAPNFMTQLPTSNDAATGTDWVKGYFVGLSENGVVLGKQSYSYTELAHATGQFRPGRSYGLRVECEGARIRVLVDGILYIDYTDPEPFMQGMVGIRSHDCKAIYEDLTVTGLGREAKDDQERR